MRADSTTRGAERHARSRNHGARSSGRAPIEGAEPRLWAFDALRAVAMLLVVVVHAAGAYIVVRVPDLLWAVRDPSRSLVLDAIFWASVGIAMPVFFALSGFFATRTFDTRGSEGFARDRTRRILVPFLVATATVLPLELAVWALGWLGVGRCNWEQLWAMKFLDETIKYNLIGPGHLWFLEYLVLMLAAYWWVRTRWGRPVDGMTVPGDGPTWLARNAWAPVVLAVPTALILWTRHAMVGLDAMETQRNSFLPDPFRWGHYAWFFAVGVLMYRARRDLTRLKATTPWHLVAAVLMFRVRFGLLGRDLIVPVQGWDAVALAVSGALFSWFTLFGVLGLALRVAGRPRRSVRYLADSSYWVYLIHMPVVGLAQVGLRWTPWPCGVKFAAVLTVTLGVSLASYEVMVRRTRLGRSLNGPGRREGAPGAGHSGPSATCPARPLGLR